MLYRPLVNLQLRWKAHTASLSNDRGEGLVSNTVIYVGVAALAGLLLVAGGAYLGAWLNIWPAPALPTIP